MTLVLKPVGRGNWAALLLTMTGKRAAPLLVQKGERLPIGGVLYRVVEVKA